MPVTQLTDQTVRNIVHSSVGGDSLRIGLSNVFGDRPVVVGEASVGRVSTGAGLVAGTGRPVTFGGRHSVSIPAGADIVSDPVGLRVRPLSDLAVSLYVQGDSGPVTSHFDAQQVNYIASGRHASDIGAAAFGTTAQAWYLLDSVSVAGTASPGAVVTLGDSVTDGFRSTVGNNARWPDILARRLRRAYGERSPAVLNAGISGNRLMHDSDCFGVSALGRLDRDALTQPAATTIILLEGVNDIGFSLAPDSGCTQPNTSVTAAQIIAADQRIIARAHGHRLRILGGTLTPFRDAAHWSPEAERKRDSVNAWIRTSGSFDGVIDFAKALAAPGRPQTLDPMYDSGDHLHPNDAGYLAMAESISLSTLLR
jgi:lysophospholipase L1-like esterase